ncbi:hypothetical protein ACHMW6_03960 [Pseudoduganella sp. UC29_106]|uniref:hypothetical protein n=1 Tax=Pseudoduganella sp. UC29_106 TaxID=3374553 RepID=UPI003756D8D3
MDCSAELRAFPLELAGAVQRVAAELTPGSLLPPSANGHTVWVQDEALCMPYRLYYQSGAVLAPREGTDALIAACLGSRLHDGFVREPCAEYLLRHPTPWTTPFVVALLGEYVVEIVQKIEIALAGAPLSTYAAFANQNPAFMATTRRRAISYWNQYYRRQYPLKDAYPGLLALSAIGAAASAEQFAELRRDAAIDDSGA